MYPFIIISAKRLYCGVNQYIAIINSRLGEVIKYLFKENKNVSIRYVKLTKGRICAGYIFSLFSFEDG
jgi:hypothetical protein